MSGGWYLVILLSLVLAYSLWCSTSSSWLSTTVSTESQLSMKLFQSKKKRCQLGANETITREHKTTSHLFVNWLTCKFLNSWHVCRDVFVINLNHMLWGFPKQVIHNVPFCHLLLLSICLKEGDLCQEVNLNVLITFINTSKKVVLKSVSFNIICPIDTSYL